MLNFLESSDDCKSILVTKSDKLCRDLKTFCELQEKYVVISNQDENRTKTWLKNWVEAKSTNPVNPWLNVWIKNVQKLVKGE